MLEVVDSCPLCAGSAWSVQTQRMPVAEDNRYARELAELLGLSVRDLAASVTERTCSQCFSVFLSPYPTYDVQSRMYLSRSPAHALGWKNFEAALQGVASRTDCLRLAQEMGVPLSAGPLVIAEFGCPFYGPSLRESVLANRLDARFMRMLDKPRSRDALSRPARLDAMMQRVAARFIALALWVRRRPRGKREEALTFPGERIMIVDESLLRWGRSCIRYGYNCAAVASEALEMKVLTIDQLSRQRRRVDLSIVFNVIDHCDRPLEVLDVLAESSRLLMLAGHLPEQAALQHRFAMTEATAQFLARRWSRRLWSRTDGVGGGADFVWVYGERVAVANSS